MSFWREDPFFYNRHLYREWFTDFDQRKISLDQLYTWYLNERRKDGSEYDNYFNLRHYGVEKPNKPEGSEIEFIKQDEASTPSKVNELIEAIVGIICDLDYASFETTYNSMTDEQARLELKRRMDIILNFKDSDIENI
jgi:hypothetical protein